MLIGLCSALVTSSGKMSTHKEEDLEYKLHRGRYGTRHGDGVNAVFMPRHRHLPGIECKWETTVNLGPAQRSLQPRS